MLYLKVLFIFCIICAITEYIRSRDPINPMTWISVFTILKYCIPSFIQYDLKETRYIPSHDFNSVASEAGLLLLVEYASFAIFYFIGVWLWNKNKHRTIIKFEIISAKMVGVYISLALIGVTAIYSLWFKYYGVHLGAYHNMSGFGWANILMTNFGVIGGLLLLAHKQYRSIAIIMLLSIIILKIGAFNRVTQTLYISLGMFIVLFNVVGGKLQIRRSLLLIFSGIGIVLLVKYIDWSRGGMNFSQMIAQLNGFFMFDLGRFEHLMSALYFKPVDEVLTKEMLIKHIPFVSRIPMLNDINSAMGALPEVWFRGAKVSSTGGTLLTSTAEKYLMFGYSGVIFYSLFWGLFLSRIYQMMRDCANSALSRNDVTLGMYAILWMTNLTLDVPHLKSVLVALTIVILSGRIIIDKNMVKPNNVNAS